MKSFFKYIAASAALVTVACGDGSTSNPTTADRNELYAPSQLLSVTQQGKIQLRWSASNAEEDFKGYLVFGTTKSLSAISDKVTYPEGASKMLGRFGVPRCLSNTGFFEAFGFAAATNACGEDESKPAKEESSLRLVQEEDVKDTKKDTAAAEKEVLKNFLTCDENKGDATKLSLAATAPTTTMQTCTVSKVFNGTELVDIVDGTAMSFVVFAVKGDDFDEISWSSNALEDASSTTVSGFDRQDIKLAEKQFVKIGFSVSATSISATAAAPAACPTGTFCKILGTNNSNPSEPAIYLSRDSASNSHGQRIFVSIPTQGSSSQIELQARGAQTSWDGGEFSARIPADMPTSSYDSTGVTFVVYGNQVFDFKLTNGTGVNYGKIVFESIEYANSSVKTSEATIKTTIIVQPGVNVKHYIW